MASYTVLASQSTIQVLSPTLVVDAFQSTIQTSPSGVISSLTLEQAYFDDGQAPGFLASYANNIEAIMAGGKVIAGVGVQTLDASGLLQEGVDFTVAYTPPNSQTGPLTVQVTLSNGEIDLAGGPLGSLVNKIDNAYNNLIVLAGGTPPPAPAPPPGSGTPPPPTQPPPVPPPILGL